MSVIHLMGGEKGGMGKSFLSRTVAAYHRQHDLDLVLFDADRTSADLFRIYGEIAGCRQVIFSEADKFDDAANSIFNAALDGHRVLVNLPAHVLSSLSPWIKNNDLLDMADDEGISFVSWFVSDCSVESLLLFELVLDTWGERMEHIFVANFGMTERWERLQEDQALKQRMTKLGVKLLKFPKFIGQSDRDKISALSLPFEQAAVAEELGKLGRRRTCKFLKEAYAQFEAAGVFDGQG